jgi:SMC interacting uncharacterized protein involved in chromosome segregation
MLIALSAAKLIFEIALLCLAGQWVLGLLVGERREDNFVYQLLQRVSWPFVAMVAWVTPGRVAPRHHPWVAFLLLALAWLVVTATKISHCVQIGVALCQ